jgi:hypothetical protein
MGFFFFTFLFFFTNHFSYSIEYYLLNYLIFIFNLISILLVIYVYQSNVYLIFNKNI